MANYSVYSGSINFETSTPTAIKKANYVSKVDLKKTEIDLTSSANTIESLSLDANAIEPTGTTLDSSSQSDGASTFWQGVEEGLLSVNADIIVGATSILEGRYKVVEGLADGLINIGTGAASICCRLFGNEEAAQQVEEWGMDVVSKDVVGDIKEWFYEDTDIGREINDHANLKYDSDTAKTISDISEKVTFAATATAATVFTGGAGAAAFGAVYGMGESAERHYQADDRGNYWDLKNAGGIVLDSALSAAEAYGAGQMGATAIKGVSALGKMGFSGAKELAKEKLSDFSLKAATKTLKSQTAKIAKTAAVNTLKDKDFYVDAATTIAGDVKTGIETGEWNVGHMVTATAASYGTNFVGNLAGGVGDAVIDAKGYGKNIDSARKTAFENFDAANTTGDKWGLNKEQLAIKHVQIDEAAGRLLDADAMDDYSKFYEVLGTEKGSRPDPSTYLKADYIDSRLEMAKREGVSRFSSQGAMDYHRANNQIGYFGEKNSYKVGSADYSSSEFVQNSAAADSVVASCKSKKDLEATLSVDPYKGAVYRYDIHDAAAAGVRIPSGNEPGAYISDWIPGGMTLGGANEFIIDGVSFDKVGVSKIFD